MSHQGECGLGQLPVGPGGGKSQEELILAECTAQSALCAFFLLILGRARWAGVMILEVTQE